jgi:hypothetical protein
MSTNERAQLKCLYAEKKKSYDNLNILIRGDIVTAREHLNLFASPIETIDADAMLATTQEVWRKIHEMRDLRKLINDIQRQLD